jgi:hypothetical protein
VRVVHLFTPPPSSFSLGHHLEHVADFQPLTSCQHNEGASQSGANSRLISCSPLFGTMTSLLPISFTYTLSASHTPTSIATPRGPSNLRVSDSATSGV